jgi:hypothetical protein
MRLPDPLLAHMMFVRTPQMGWAGTGWQYERLAPTFFNDGGPNMAKQTRTPVGPGSNPDITWRDAFSLEQREAMIRDAAYYHYAKRGYAPGHELEDWLAAEAEIERISSDTAELPPGAGVQQSSVHGAGKDEELKRIIKQHPQKAIPQIESVEPEKAPFRE